MPRRRTNTDHSIDHVDDTDEQNIWSAYYAQERHFPLCLLHVNEETTNGNYYSDHNDYADKHDLQRASNVRDGGEHSSTDRPVTVQHIKPLPNATRKLSALLMTSKLLSQS